MSTYYSIGEQDAHYPGFLHDLSDDYPQDHRRNIELARKNLTSIKSEVDRGAPIDPLMIEEMEAALDRLEHREPPEE
jgi:hypothetical protein